jgi:hypothetical protein
MGAIDQGIILAVFLTFQILQAKAAYCDVGTDLGDGFIYVPALPDLKNLAGFEVYLPYFHRFNGGGNGCLAL